MHKVVEIKNAYKFFGKVRALNNAQINIYQGRVMGLIGENGAGKSTIIKCLAGIYQLDVGEYFINGQKVRLKEISDAKKYGIAVVHQELQLSLNLSVAENIFLGRLPSTMGLILKKNVAKKAQKILDMLHVDINPKALVSSLSIAKQQMVEIARALSINARIIILDEPTDALSGVETKILFKTIKSLQKSGVSFLYVSHRMSEIPQICQEITIFRDGQYIKEMKANAPLPDIIEHMIGRQLSEYFPKSKIQILHKPAKYVFKNFTNQVVQNVSFLVKEGEIFALAGLIGSGRTEFAQSVVGITPKHSGTILKNGQPLYLKNISQAIAQGVYYVPEDRKRTGLIIDGAIRDNIIISSYDQVQWKCLRILNWIKLTNLVTTSQNHFAIKMHSQKDPVSSLSGGNQQKVLLAKALLTQPDLLILDEPTRGVDIGARKEIYHILRNITQKGTSIIMITSELNEAIGMSDRIGVFHNGRIAGILEKKQFSEKAIIQLAIGTGDKNVEQDI